MVFIIDPILEKITKKFLGLLNSKNRKITKSVFSFAGLAGFHLPILNDYLDGNRNTPGYLFCFIAPQFLPLD